MGLPTAPASGGGIPLSTPSQMQAQQERMQEQLKLRMGIAANLKRFRHVVIVMSGKGGVGKSTVAVNIAAAFAATGRKVGLLDLDLTNPNVPHMLGVGDAKPRPGPGGGIGPVRVGENLSVMSTEFFLVGRETAIIWRGPIKMNMIQQMIGIVEWGDLDLLVIDLPPGTGDEPLSIAQLLKDADGVVLVTTPQSVSVLDVKKSVQFVQTMDLPILGVVENMATYVCQHCAKPTDIFGRGGGAEIARQYGVPLLGQIPIEPAVGESATKGEPLVWRKEDSHAKAAFFDVVREIEARLKAKPSA